MRLCFSLVLLALLGACTAVNRYGYGDPAKPHHTAQGFKNNYIGQVDKSFSELVRWQIERRQQDLPKPPDRPTPATQPDLPAIRSYAAGKPAAVTWIGHATVLVQSGGLNVLTDPIFSERASPVQFLGPQRAQPPGVSLGDLPPIDVVLISHNHYDHLDGQSVRQIAQRSAAAGKATTFLVPLGLKSWFNDLGIDTVVELDWWDSRSVAGVQFTFTPVQHWSARGFGDRSQTLWGGFAVFAPDLRWYFTGDTGYSKDFADTRARLAAQHPANEGAVFDLALIPVGAYQPRWFLKDQHVNPDEAVQIHQDVGARQSIGIHWGTFALSDESLDQPPKDLATAAHARGLAPEAFTVMAVGETRQMPAPRNAGKP